VIACPRKGGARTAGDLLPDGWCSHPGDFFRGTASSAGHTKTRPSRSGGRLPSCACPRRGNYARPLPPHAVAAVYIHQDPTGHGNARAVGCQEFRSRATRQGHPCGGASSPLAQRSRAAHLFLTASFSVCTSLSHERWSRLGVGAGKHVWSSAGFPRYKAGPRRCEFSAIATNFVN
jgi:hypothetical protein